MLASLGYSSTKENALRSARLTHRAEAMEQKGRYGQRESSRLDERRRIRRILAFVPAMLAGELSHWAEQAYSAVD